jgi:O-antigen ligase
MKTAPKNRRKMLAAVAAGILDISVTYSFLLDIPVTQWYGITLALKALAIVATRAPGLGNVLRNIGFFAILIVLYITSTISGSQTLESLPQFLGFCFQCSGTLLLIAPDKFHLYCRAVALSGLSIATIYVPYALLGYSGEHFGRYLFFGGSHPNLGAEILTVCLVLGAIAYPPKMNLMISTPSLGAIFLLQGRAAFAVSILVLFISLVQGMGSWYKSRAFAIWLGCAAMVIMIVVLAVGDVITDLLRIAFLVDDDFRGIGTGLTGRDTRWGQAIDVFLAHPMFGVGFGYYQLTGTESPHNAFLYALAELGLAATALYVWFFRAVVRTAQANIRTAVLLAPLAILLMLNDRFINSNPYPLVLFITLMTVQNLPVGNRSARFDPHAAAR